MALSLLGEDGLGYELARRLDACGSWRAWLGDAAYTAFAHSLASPAAWDALMAPSPSASRAHLHLQLRIRALLFDKASDALFLRPAASASAVDGAAPLAAINPEYLKLHGDDIYYSLEDCQQDGGRNESQLKTTFSTSKVNEHSYERASNIGPKYNEHTNSTLPRHRLEELPESWYSKFLREYRMRHHTFPYCDKEPQKRTPEGMSMFYKLSDAHKRKRQAFEECQTVTTKDPKKGTGCPSNSKMSSDLTTLSEEEFNFFPEMLFPSNCVPDSAIPPSKAAEKNKKVKVSEVLDNLPSIISRSPAMIERFGIIPEYHKMGGKYRGKDSSGGEKISLGEEVACKMTRKVVASTLARLGFEAGSESAIEVLSDVCSAHICKLGRTLKLLTDSYKKKFSSIDLLKMFLQTTGHNNVGALPEFIKDSNKGFTQQTNQNVRVMQPPQGPQQNMLLQDPQCDSETSGGPAQSSIFKGNETSPVPRTLLRQMQLQQLQLLHPQNLVFQQQQQQLIRRRQMANRGSLVIMDKDQQIGDVKLENVMESSMESILSTLNKQQHLQLRQQLALSQQHSQLNQRYKQMPNVQLPQLQAQNSYGMRTQPVKVEAFHEMMTGDSTTQPESDQNKLSSSQQ